MIPLATTELGTDAWIKDLMGPAMGKIGLDGIWVLIYTATVMMLLRLKAIGDLSKRFSPLQILAFSSIFAACGIYFLSVSSVSPWFILGAATVYGIGQTFFWPCTLGLVAEQFPKGGALTINAIAGVGMLGVGIIGTPLLGNLQDTQIYKTLKTNQPEYYQEFILEENKNSIFGEYQQLDQESMKKLDTDLADDDGSESFQRLQEKRKALTRSTSEAKSELASPEMAVGCIEDAQVDRSAPKSKPLPPKSSKAEVASFSLVGSMNSKPWSTVKVIRQLLQQQAF